MPPDHGPRKPTPDPDLAGGREDAGEAGAGPPLDVWSWLPRLPLRQVRLEQRAAEWTKSEGWTGWIDWLGSRLKQEFRLGPPEVVCRGSGLRRPGLIAQFRLPGWNTRMAVGLEVALAHAVVDGLLGYDRPVAESRLQLTPVEWGVWSYLAVLALARIEKHVKQPGMPALLLDRVGPDLFDPTHLGAIVTVRWPVHVGATAGTARLWISESALGLLAISGQPTAESWLGPSSPRARDLSSVWRAQAGFVAMPQGLKRLRVGSILPLSDTRLGGTPQSPTGPVNLVCDLSGAGGRYVLPTEPVEGSSGRLVRLTGPIGHEPAPRESLTLGVNQTMTPNPDHSAARSGQSTDPGSTDIPVTLIVELGRLNLTLSRLADLKAGDVLELGRHSREPVELTSAGRLVARGELILIDTELGVRVTHVFL
jgi:flagellar motor switch protein FliN